MSFVYHVRPRYAEIDMQRVVFNAHWLTFFDDANTQWWPWAGVDLTKLLSGGFEIMLVKAVLEWHGPAGWMEDIAVEVFPSRVGTSSFDFTYRAAVAERPVCTGVLTYVSVDLDPDHGGRSRPIPEGARVALERHRHQGSATIAE
jgi:acyl-CoA thioester hydrolase